MTYDGVPILDVQHPALRAKTGIRGGMAWRCAQAAQRFGLDYDTFAELPRDQRVTILAQFEINWRVEALSHWEHRQDARNKNVQGKRRS